MCINSNMQTSMHVLVFLWIKISVCVLMYYEWVFGVCWWTRGGAREVFYSWRTSAVWIFSRWLLYSTFCWPLILTGLFSCVTVEPPALARLGLRPALVLAAFTNIEKLKVVVGCGGVARFCSSVINTHKVFAYKLLAGEAASSVCVRTKRSDQLLLGSANFEWKVTVQLHEGTRFFVFFWGGALWQNRIKGIKDLECSGE